MRKGAARTRKSTSRAYGKRKPRSQPASRRRLAAAALSLAIVGVLGYVYLGGSHGLIRIYQLRRQREVLRHQILELQAEREIMMKENRELREEPAAIERVAREELGMVKGGEVVYRFVEPEPDSSR